MPCLKIWKRVSEGADTQWVNVCMNVFVPVLLFVLPLIQLLTLLFRLYCHLSLHLFQLLVLLILLDHWEAFPSQLAEPP